MQVHRKIRITYIIFQYSRWAVFEWQASLLNKDLFDLSFILISEGTASLAQHLDKIGIEYIVLPFNHNRNEYPAIAEKVAHYCKIKKPDIVHTHFQIACLAGLIGAKNANVPIRIHTRHHAGPYPSQHREEGYSKWDTMINNASTHVVALDLLVKEVLINEQVPEDNVSIVYTGFELDDFAQVPSKNIKRLQKKYLPEDAWPVVGAMSRYQHLKGVKYIIKAFERVLDRYPKAFLVLANAWGADEIAIRKCLSRIPEDRYLEIPYENDSFSLYQLFDVFVHVPIARHYEAFGQVYVEALAAKIPAVFTKAGIADEFIEHKKNAWVVNFENSDQIYEGIIELLENPVQSARLTAQGFKDVKQRFHCEQMIHALENLYLKTFQSIKNYKLSEVSHSLKGLITE